MFNAVNEKPSMEPLPNMLRKNSKGLSGAETFTQN